MPESFNPEDSEHARHLAEKSPEDRAIDEEERAELEEVDRDIREYWQQRATLNRHSGITAEQIAAAARRIREDRLQAANATNMLSDSLSPFEEDKADLLGNGLNILLSIPLGFLRAYVIQRLWNWFVPTTFSKVPGMTMAQASGLVLVSAILGPQESDAQIVEYLDEKLTPRRVIKVNTYRAFTYAAMFGIGALIRRYINGRTSKR